MGRTLHHCHMLTARRLARMRRLRSIVGPRRTYDTSRCHLFKGTKQHFCFTVISVSQPPFCVVLASSSLFFPLCHSLAPSHSFFYTPSPTFIFFPSLTSSQQGRFGPGAVLCCLICTAHSCSFYYCPSGGGGPFLWPDNGRRRDREHGGHVPFATPRYLSILARPTAPLTHPPNPSHPLSAFQQHPNTVTGEKDLGAFNTPQASGATAIYILLA